MVRARTEGEIQGPPVPGLCGSAATAREEGAEMTGAQLWQRLTLRVLQGIVAVAAVGSLWHINDEVNDYDPYESDGCAVTCAGG